MKTGKIGGPEEAHAILRTYEKLDKEDAARHAASRFRQKDPGPPLSPGTVVMGVLAPGLLTQEFLELQHRITVLEQELWHKDQDIERLERLVDICPHGLSCNVCHPPGK